MERKDVTPKMKKNNGIWRKLGLGLVGGIIGGLVTAGIFYAVMGSGNAASNSGGHQNSAGETVVENVKVNVDSDITYAVDKVQDAVVSVINLQSQNQGTNGFGQLFGQQQQESSDDSNLEASSEGSGVIYKKSGNSAYIVTNNHVVEGQQGLEVLLKDGTKVKAELVGTDAYSDLAVLKISADKVNKVASFGDSNSLKVGEPAIAIGSPLGSEYANSVTSGIISSLNRQVTSTNESNQTVNINAIQTDAAINPGNSGGPLVNIEGQVIGINSSKIASTSASSSGVSVEGMGFAIPSNDVVNIINQLEKDGKVTRPALGITMVDLSAVSTQQQEQILKIPESVTNGVIVTSVQPATPAEKAGLKQYDVITKIDDTDVSSGVELQSVLYQKKVGDSVKVTYYRGKEKKTTTIQLTIDQSALKQSQSENSGN
ncbi:S1C family serine protease [Enterococcus hirae]|uniref:S1C family serine protease n=1 Tax=Enterococcus hirae TaxID=1354 RepID=UPI002220B84F|nr:trypsin-like peptidase domain-containing protein [Enterococcus hirae]EMF0047316.1 trypsin-like peptidase domain-containing protein [Enterococcus hirae]EMF0085721.1 trypsin-like peptidase domain-containing protein [Enterococcus hirae]UYT95079.1 trypsin-like peptidase domain-containing protein [Enterococcus hirae]UYT98167.1 trypsin-like peptidase domain-containing protein [Enterococcus hirae]UYU00127.1 trypsin-like peptidase domain-containing protein [Enterococcus hirae]